MPPPSELIPASDVRSMLSDAFLSFSPFATLLGADSARAFAQRVTNFKQTLVVSLAPTGALSMMAIACKSADLPGLKDMLGVGDEDLGDAASAVGCVTALGNTVGKMDGRGGLTSTTRRHDHDGTGAIVRLRWETDGQPLDFEALQQVVHVFAASAMTGRMMWELPREQFKVRVLAVKRTLMTGWNGSMVPFELTHELKGGEGMIELHWPAPAMTLETTSIYVILHGLFFGLAFLSVAIVPAIFRNSGQTPLASAFLVTGQVFLILGQVGTQYSVKQMRETCNVRIPSTGLGEHWIMTDRTRFTSSVARRPYAFPPSSRDHIILRQHRSLKGSSVKSWKALLMLLLLAVGFLAFYLGGKSSHIRTVGLYIFLFIAANILKGPLVRHANKPIFTLLNNLGHGNAMSNKSNRLAQESRAVRDRLVPRPADQTCDLSGQHNDVANGQGIELTSRNPLTQAHPSQTICQVDDRSATTPQPMQESRDEGDIRIYTRFSIRGIKAVDLFCFSCADEWILAAQIIQKTVKETNPQQHSDQNVREELLQMPLYQWIPTADGGDARFHGLLLLAIDNIKSTDLYWSLGMEVMTILIHGYHPDKLCSEGVDATRVSFLAAFVYSCTHMLLSRHLNCDGLTLPGDRRGHQTLDRAIEHTTRGASNPHPNMHWIISQLGLAARAAVEAVQNVDCPDPEPEPEHGLNTLPADEPNQSSAEWISSSENQLEAILRQLKLLDLLRQTNQGNYGKAGATMNSRISVLLAALRNESIEGLLEEILTSLGDCRLRWLLASSSDTYLRWPSAWGTQSPPQKQPGTWDIVLGWGTDEHTAAEARWMLGAQHWWEPARIFWPKLLRNPAKSKTLRVLVGCVWFLIWVSSVVPLGVAGANHKLQISVSLIVCLCFVFPILIAHSFDCISWTRLRLRQLFLLRLAFQQSTIRELTKNSRRAAGLAEWLKNEDLQNEERRIWMIEKQARTLQSELRKQRNALLMRMEQVQWRLATR